MSEHKIKLPPIPAKRYFTEQEVCELAGISQASLKTWLEEQNDARATAANCFYLRQHVLALRAVSEQLQDYGFALGRGHVSANGSEPRLTACQVRSELEEILKGLHEIAAVNSSQN